MHGYFESSHLLHNEIIDRVSIILNQMTGYLYYSQTMLDYEPESKGHAQ